jgi:exodeoxyribonuclease X
MTLIVRVVDLETTGLAPPEAAVCELGHTDVWHAKPEDGEPHWHVGRPISCFVNPGRPIPPEVSAVHHIVDADVVGAKSFDEAIAPVLHGTKVVLCAHNAKFEQQFITTPATWICSYKVALHLAPKAPAHNLQTLRYWIKLDVDPDEAQPAHRAGPDSYVNAALMARMLAKLSIEDMVTISARPALLPKLHFGEHADKWLRDVPTDFLEWILKPGKRKPFDEDVIFTAKHHLELRAQQ